MKKREFSTEVGGKTLTATFSDLADQANGSVILTYGKTSVLATAVMSESEREGIDFFPLTVDYEEKFYAAGVPAVCFTRTAQETNLVAVCRLLVFLSSRESEATGLKNHKNLVQ